MTVLNRLTQTDLSRRDRLIGYYLVGLVVVVTAYAIAYNVVMAQLENVDQSIFASLEFVVQTMTTTGYGQDSGTWSHPLTFLFVVVTQVSGIGIGFFTLRLIIIPLFTGAEVNLDNRLTPKDDHVIICEYRRDSVVLLDELTELGVEYVLIATSRENATRLSNEGYSVIHGSPQNAETLDRAGIDTARAVITDAGDANVETILTVESARPDVELIALTDDSDRRRVLRQAGADTVLSPRRLLGQRLADKAVSSFSAAFDTIDLGDDLEVTEVPVHHDSRLVGTRIRDSTLREQTGANVIGAWVDGDLQLPPDPDTVIRPNTVLLVSGAHDELEAFSDFTKPARSFQQHDRIIIAGHGEVGGAASEVLAADTDVVLIDTDDSEEIDVVGDATEQTTLSDAGIDAADAIILALPNDSVSLLATVLARSLDEDIEILLRASATDATRKALSAGADYVLSVPRVSARMVARELRGEDIPAPASQIRLLRVPAAPFAGERLADTDISEDTGCRVVAVEDDSGLSDTIDPRRRFTGDEELVIVGSDESVQAFLKQYDVSSVTQP